MDETQRKLMALSGARPTGGSLTADGDPYYFAPAGFPGNRTGWALYTSSGEFFDVQKSKPQGLTPHTKARPQVKNRIAQDAPKRKHR